MWVKGQSGNPGGRPKKTPEQLFVEQECRENYKNKVLPLLVRWLESGNESKQKFAASEFRELGFVPHAQSHDITERKADCEPDELEGRIADIIGRKPGCGHGCDSAGGKAATP